MIKGKLFEVLVACLFEYKERIKTASENDLILIAEAIEHVTVLIMRIEGGCLDQVQPEKREQFE